MDRLARAIDPAASVVVLNADEANEHPGSIWNAFVTVLAMRSYDDLRPDQRSAHLVFWYDAEVQNGGHGQFLESEAGARAAETVHALRTLGAEAHANLLARAVAANRNCGALEELDREQGMIEPDVLTFLARHLESDPSRYVRLERHA